MMFYIPKDLLAWLDEFSSKEGWSRPLSAKNGLLPLILVINAANKYKTNLLSHFDVKSDTLVKLLKTF